ncbi:hypothetical protein TNCV_645061 [Trichonephila clavipes]|nr:hypothetical protein TNCV_645061 [Trichonephila clavipes]
MASFERKTLQSILGGVNENNSWKRRYNFELYRIYKQPGIIKHIKINRMNWMTHIIWIPDDDLSKRYCSSKSHWDSEVKKTNAEMDRLGGIRFWDYKRENLDNEGEQEVTMEESSKEGTGS